MGFKVWSWSRTWLTDISWSLSIISLKFGWEIFWYQWKSFLYFLQPIGKLEKIKGEKQALAIINVQDSKNEKYYERYRMQLVWDSRFFNSNPNSIGYTLLLYVANLWKFHYILSHIFWSLVIWSPQIFLWNMFDRFSVTKLCTWLYCNSCWKVLKQVWSIETFFFIFLEKTEHISIYSKAYP